MQATAISFETAVPRNEEFSRRIALTLDAHPWIVCEIEGEIAGYAYACSHRQRAAYQWCVETSVYVREDFHRSGVGRGLYEKLQDGLRHQGYRNLYAGVTLPNEASVRFHESMGYEQIGVYKSIGHKFGKWHDVGWWGLAIADADNPNPPVPLPDCRATIENILAGT